MRLPFVSGLAILVGICLTAGFGSANLAPEDRGGQHRSSLRATVTMLDRSTRNVTLEGVGCFTSMCSRVRAREAAAAIWLDGLTSVRGISHAPGPVTATFRFKDGAERQAAIIAANRVLYVRYQSGPLEKLDLGDATKIDFLDPSARFSPR